MNSTMTLKTLLLASLLSINAMVLAAEGQVEMEFSGMLIEPPACTINEGNRVDVNFGERIGINKVDGVNYRQPMNYQISCGEGGGSVQKLTLTLSGKATTFDKQALQSSQDNLGVRIYQNDQPFTPGSTLTIDQSDPPQLEAVPVKNKGASLKEGRFEAWATLRVDYQ